MSSLVRKHERKGRDRPEFAVRSSIQSQFFTYGVQELRRNEKLTDEAGVLAQNEANDDRGAYSSSSGFVDEGLASETPISGGCVEIDKISRSEFGSVI